MCAERILAIVLSAALLVSGCSAGWRHVEPVVPEKFSRRQQVQVWNGGQASVLHSVRIDTMSLSGTPFTENPACEPCRMEIPLTEVDSVRLGNKETGYFILMGAVVAVSLLGFVIGSGLSAQN